MAPGSYLAGACLFALVLGGATYAAETVRRRRFPHLSGAPLVAALTILISCALGLTTLLPGLLGALTAGTAAGCAILLALGSRLVPDVAARTRPQTGEEPEPVDRVGAALAAGAVAVIGAWWVAEFLHTAGAPYTAVDLISSDLPVIGRWIQTGSIWHFTELYPYQTHGTYPHNAHLLLAAVVLPFHNDALIRFLSYPFLPLAGVAVYATCRELRAPRSTAIVFAAMFMAVPTVATDVENNPPDTLSLALFAAGLLFLIRHARTPTRSELVLAGLGLGFAAGGMWYFSSAVVLLAASWAAWSILRVRGRRRFAARQAVLCIALIGASSAFWLIRNLVVSGDPVYPVPVAVGGRTIFGAPFDVYRHAAGFSIADYLSNAHVLRHYIVPALRKGLGLSGLLAAVGVIWTLIVTLRRRRQRDPDNDRLAFLAGVSVLLAILYVLTPYSAFGPHNAPLLAWVNVRYALPALTVAIPLTAAMAGRTRRARRVAEVAGLVATVQGTRAAYYILLTGGGSLRAGFGVAVVLAAGAVAWRYMRHRRSRSRAGPGFSATRAVWVPLAALGAAVMLLGGYAAQRVVNRDRYAPYDATYAWIQQHPAAQRIGLSGSFDFSAVSPGWPLFGKRLQNYVSFVGPLAHGQLRQYTSEAEWLSALRRGHYTLVEIARTPPRLPLTDHEVEWAASARLQVLSASQHFELVRVPLER